ncbi:Aspartate carbamoyltransferase regulatory chain [Candidatus Arsenophonus lipoptenae]|uniref:Aspartate carbamoyltransferase regulatory chain n=1 Tax=Candidatus Arsenophonus lipoptenae TaxID=634113 RepID=A0A0X9VF02_9GAMM|nr:aspartate carbamoyltransferase regulatory subunit [Candidatus Arsenophonus lipoptenae]AMA65184.1 Aspartate carbamoyltransferase regulatory chain [Candidatus Arsenophonus lipoptenae]
MANNHKLQVEAIRCGTVIDHITAKIGFKLLLLFKLTQTDQRITVGLNLPSNLLGRKDLIKIENTFLTSEQANKLAIYAPNATINCIKDYKVEKKLSINIPEQIDEVLICPNTNCISHNEPIISSFNIIKQNHDVILICKYCEQIFNRNAVINNM